MDRTSVATKLASMPGDDLLVVGVGIGNDLSPFVDAKKHITGVDILPPYHTQYEHIRGDYCTIPFGANQFDMILCSHTLEHMINPGLVLQKIKSELKVGGWFGLNVPGWEQDRYHAGHLTLWTPFHVIGYLTATGWDATDAYWYTTNDHDDIGFMIQNKDTPEHDCNYGLKKWFPKGIGLHDGHMSAWLADRWFDVDA